MADKAACLRIVALYLLCAAACAQVITTSAGTGWFFPANSLPAINAPLASVQSVATDFRGNLYLADAINNIVARVTPDGVLSVVAGNGAQGFTGDNGQATSAALYHPTAVALDAAGNLYIADTVNHRIRRVAPDGNIGTIAGTGKPGYSGDGGPATNAQLNNPAGVSADAGGNLYIADTMNHAIRKISAGGTITTIAGTGSPGFSGDGGPSAGAKLSFPYGLAFDNFGNLFIADGGNSRIRQISTTGTITTVAGNGSFGYSGDGGPALNGSLGTPHAVSLDTAGNLYVADYQNNRIRKVTPTGIIITIAGNGSPGFSGDATPAIGAMLNNPSGVAFGAAGDLFIADSQNNRIRRVGLDGIINTLAGNGGYRFSGDGGQARNAVLNSPAGVALGRAGDVYIPDTLNHRVRKVALDGTISTVAGNGLAGMTGDGLLATGASLNSPSTVAVDSAGNLYIADTNNNSIRRVAANGVISTVAGDGTVGGPLSHPTSVAVDSAGNLYVADYGNNRVREVTLDGQITTIVGNGIQGFSGDNGPAIRAQLYDPVSVAVDASRNLYIADSFNNRIRKVTPDGIISTVAGSGAFGSSGDGGPAINAALGGPGGVTVDSIGNLYIAETNTSHVRRVTTGGVITTVAGNGNFDFSGDGGPAVSAALNFPEGVAVDAAGNLYIADTLNNRVREVISPATVRFQASPLSLGFSATSTGAPPPAQTISLSSSIAGVGFAASADSPWIAITHASGAMPSILQVTVDPSSLSPGTYHAMITITVPNATPSTATITITFNVQPAPPPQLSVSSQRLAFAVTKGAGALTAQIQIQNAGGGILAFSATSSTNSGDWLSVSPSVGTATPSTPASINVTATPGTFPPGTYPGTITIVGGVSTVNVNVTLAISPANARILASQSGLSFTAAQQGGAPLPQSIGILNTGQGSMDWTATAAALSGGDWLHISPSNGTVAQPYVDVSQMSVLIDPSGLSPGDYFGKIQISAGADNSPQLVTVILTVLPDGVSPGPELRPAALIFTGAAGSTPGSQDVLIGNPKAVPDTFTSAQIGTSFAYLPTNSTVMPNQPGTLRVFPDFSQLAPGTVQNGVITLLFSDGTARNISVLTVVAPVAAGSGARFGAQAANCSSPELHVQFRSPDAQPVLTAIQGRPITLEIQVVDSCGNLVGPGGVHSAAVVSSFSNGDPDLNLVHVGNGIWAGTWKPLNAGVGTTSVTVAAVNAAAQVQQSGRSITLQAAISASTANSPFVSSSPANAASGDATFVAPGSLVSIYGQGLSSGAVQAPGAILPSQLNGTQVLTSNQSSPNQSEALPLLFVNNGQINAQIPFDLPPNTQLQLVVQNGSAVSVPQNFLVATVQPAIYTQDGSGMGTAIIVDQNSQPITADNPPIVGEPMVIYCNGLGAVNPPVPSGVPAPVGATPSQTVYPVTVTINGVDTPASFAGLTPGSTGLYQVNVIVPDGADAGSVDDVVLFVSIDGQKSPPVTTKRPGRRAGTGSPKGHDQ